MSTYVWEGKTYSLPPFDMEKLVAGSIETRKEKGMFRTEFPTEHCSACGGAVPPIPARCWGHAVPGFWMTGLETHRCGVLIQQGVEVYRPQKPKVYAEHVVLIQGNPLFVTEDEHKDYTTRAVAGKFPMFLKGAVIDKIYATIPYSDWAENERRRGREVESRLIIG